MRIVQIALAFLLPVAAVILVLTFSGTKSESPLTIHSPSGSYPAVVDRPLTVTAFRFSNPGKATLRIDTFRVAEKVAGLEVLGALAYRGCANCVADTAVPPTLAPPVDVPAPPLLPVRSFELKPGATLTLLLSVKLTREGRVRVPPMRLDVTDATGKRVVETVQGPTVCAGRNC